MNRIFIIALILLLPLRGWGAESMTIQMASSMISSGIAMMDGSTAITNMPADCPLMGLSTGVAPEAKSSASVNHKTCKTCQLCMALVAWGSEPPAFAYYTPSATPNWSVSTFASADVSRNSKPPIL